MSQVLLMKRTVRSASEQTQTPAHHRGRQTRPSGPSSTRTSTPTSPPPLPPAQLGQRLAPRNSQMPSSLSSAAATPASPAAEAALSCYGAAAASLTVATRTRNGWIIAGPLDASLGNPPPVLAPAPAPAPAPLPVPTGFASDVETGGATSDATGGASGGASGRLREGARGTARRLEEEVELGAATPAEETTMLVRAQGAGAAAESDSSSPRVAPGLQASAAGLAGMGPPREEGGEHTRAVEHGVGGGEADRRRRAAEDGARCAVSEPEPVERQEAACGVGEGGAAGDVVGTATAAAGTAAAAAAATGYTTPMANLADEAYTVVLVDVETTGLYPKTNRVIQLAAKVFGSQEPQHVFSEYVEPEGACLSYFIQRLTGITPQILAANNARPFREVWPRFASWLTTVASGRGRGRGGGGSGGVEGAGGGVVMVAHNASFDRNFLGHEVARAELDSYTMARIGVVSFVDSIAVLRHESLWWHSGDGPNVRAQPGCFNLGALFKHAYGVEMPGAHTALGDVKGLELVLSAPGVRERWRSVASTDPACQIPVGCPFDQARVRPKNTPSTRTGTTITVVVAPQVSDAPERVGAGEAAGAPVEATTRLANSRMRAAVWAREQNARKTRRR